MVDAMEQIWAVVKVLLLGFGLEEVKEFGKALVKVDSLDS